MPNIRPISDLKNDTEVLNATIRLLAKLEEGERSAREKGWLSAEEVETKLGL